MNVYVHKSGRKLKWTSTEEYTEDENSRCQQAAAELGGTLVWKKKLEEKDMEELLITAELRSVHGCYLPIIVVVIC
jgi:hypothetical protein